MEVAPSRGIGSCRVGCAIYNDTKGGSASGDSEDSARAFSTRRDHCARARDECGV